MTDEYMTKWINRTLGAVVILAFTIITLGTCMGGCTPRPAKKEKETTLLAEDIAVDDIINRRWLYMRRVKDNTYNVVCYLYSSGISCVSLTKNNNAENPQIP